MVAVVHSLSMNFGRTGGLVDLGVTPVGTQVTLTFRNLAASTAYKVDLGYGTPDLSVTSNGSGVATVNHTFTEGGKFTVTLRNSANTATISQTDVYTSGVITYSAPVNATVAETFTFALARGTSYSVDWGDGSADDTITTSAGTNERQTLTLTGSPTGGDFAATIAGISVTIPYNASVSAVQALVDAKPTLVGNVTVSGSTGAWAFDFVDDLAFTNVATISINAAGLTGGTSPNVTVATNTAGAAAATTTANHTYATTGSKTITVTDTRFNEVVATKTLTVAS